MNTKYFCLSLTISLDPNFNLARNNLADALSKKDRTFQKDDLATFCQKHHSIDISVGRPSLSVCLLPPEIWAAAGSLQSQSVINCLGDEGYPLFVKTLEEAANAEESGDYVEVGNALKDYCDGSIIFSRMVPSR